MNRIVSTDLINLNKKYRPIYLNPQFFNFWPYRDLVVNATTEMSA